MLQNEQNEWIRDPHALQVMACNFFSKLYTTVDHRDYTPILQQCPHVVTKEINNHLLEVVTLKEVRRATFQLGSTKAPGPDGFNGLFYQSHWDIIKDDLLLLVQTLF